MLALSTSWIAGKLRDAGQFIACLETLGVRALELEYRLEAGVFHQLKTLLPRAGIAVTSLHNYTPHPALLPAAKPSGDYFCLSAPDREERRLAIEYTRKTIDHASDMEAGVVVLHCGEVALAEPGHRRVKRLFTEQGGDSPELRHLLDSLTARREHEKGPYLDALLSALDRLLPLAERRHVTLGIENRYHYHQLPAFDELALILKEFDGAPLGYWHDTGHAHAFEVLGLVDPASHLKNYGVGLVGIHLHDARGLADHLPPGCGEIDFSVLSPYLQQEGLPVVLELAAGTDLDQVRQAVQSGREIVTEANLSLTSSGSSHMNARFEKMNHEQE